MIVDPYGHFSLPLSACVCVRVRVSEQVGEYQQISDFNNLRASLSRYYSFFATESTTGTTVITVPYYDAFGLGEFCGKFCSSLAFLLHVAAAANPTVCVVPCCGGICGVPCCGGICGVPCCGGICGVPCCGCICGVPCCGGICGVPCCGGICGTFSLLCMAAAANPAYYDRSVAVVCADCGKRFITERGFCILDVPHTFSLSVCLSVCGLGSP